MLRGTHGAGNIHLALRHILPQVAALRKELLILGFAGQIRYGNIEIQRPHGMAYRLLLLSHRYVRLTVAIIKPSHPRAIGLVITAGFGFLVKEMRRLSAPVDEESRQLEIPLFLCKTMQLYQCQLNLRVAGISVALTLIRPKHRTEMICQTPGDAQGEDRLYVNLYAASEAQVLDGRMRIRQQTDYPWSGEIALSIFCREPVEAEICLRIPAWACSFKVAVNGETLEAIRQKDGYVHIRRRWHGAQLIHLSLPMEIQAVYAPRLVECAGKRAYQRGPLVYCAEEADNGPCLHTLISQPKSAEVHME